MTLITRHAQIAFKSVGNEQRQIAMPNTGCEDRTMQQSIRKDTMNKTATSRPATPEEQAIHDAFIKQWEQQVATAHKSAQMIKLIAKVETMANRFGWAQAGHGAQLIIDESIVWRDIERKNPQPDILDDKQQKDLLWHSEMVASNLLQKLKAQTAGPRQ
jgi:hypothetical protein